MKEDVITSVEYKQDRVHRVSVKSSIKGDPSFEEDAVALVMIALKPDGTYPCAVVGSAAAVTSIMSVMPYRIAQATHPELQERIRAIAGVTVEAENEAMKGRGK